MAQESLVDGMDSMSQAKVGSALQVFFNLEELQQVCGVGGEGEGGRTAKTLPYGSATWGAGVWVHNFETNWVYTGQGPYHIPWFPFSFTPSPLRQ